MNSDNPSLAETTVSIDEEIVAYLDGELDPETAARVERRLADDPRYNARLNQLQRAWDLLDNLRRTEADDDFVQQHRGDGRGPGRRRGQDAGACGHSGGETSPGSPWPQSPVLSATTAFALLPTVSDARNRQLVRDLPVIERVDDYRNIDNLEFVKQLQRENLFAAEVDDGT